jgi:hypothetical protein
MNLDELANRKPISLIATQDAQPDDGYNHIVPLTQDERDDLILVALWAAEQAANGAPMLAPTRLALARLANPPDPKEPT